jgi:ankyrin repeat protein
LNYNGQSPLFIAARQGQLQLVKVLIQAGAHPDLNNGELVKDSEVGEVLE